MNVMGKRLYGEPGAEVMHWNLSDVWESEIEPFLEYGSERDSWEIEEWTVAPSRSHLPTVDWVLDHVADYLSDWAELTEDPFDIFEKVLKSPESEAMVEKWLSWIADKVPAGMAETHLKTFEITLDGDGKPLVNGSPMYVAFGGVGLPDA